MPNLLYDVLGVQNDIELFEFISKRLLSFLPQLRKDQGADQLLPALVSVLKERVGLILEGLSEKKLKELQQKCLEGIPSISARMIIVPDIQHTEFEFDIGDTLITPSGVYQINLHKQAQKTLNQDPMSSWVHLIPKTQQSEPVVLEMDANIQLIAALNQTMRPINTSLYLSQDRHRDEYIYSTVTAALLYLAKNTEKELNSKKIRQNNLILKALRFKTEGELLQDVISTTHSENLTQKTSKETSLKQFSDAELKTILEQCEHWIPLCSPRIISCRELPPERAIHNGDTFLLPTGLVQIQKNAAGKILKHHVLNQQQIIAYGMGTYLPREGHPSRVFQDDHILPMTLNPFLAKHPKGLYITQKDYLCENVTQNLAKLVKVEQEQRALAHSHHPFLLWSSVHTRNISRSETDVDQALTTKVQKKPSKEVHPTQKISTKALKTYARNFERFRKNIADHPHSTSIQNTQITALHDNTNEPRSRQDIEHAMEDIKNHLNASIEPNAYKLQKERDTIQLFDSKQIVMETSSDTVTIFKPLMKNSKLTPAEKATLFLKALGIPPLNGRNSIEISGGNRTLRTAIQEAFDHYLSIENIKEIPVKPQSLR